MRRTLGVLGILASGCAKQPQPQTPEPTREEAPQVSPSGPLRIAGLLQTPLRDAICAPEREVCWGLTPEGVAVLDVETMKLAEAVPVDAEVLALREGRVWGAGPCEAGWCRWPLEEADGTWGRGEAEELPELVSWRESEGAALRAQTARLWNAAIAQEWALPFLPMVPSPSGGLIAYWTGQGSGGARLVHLGVPPMAQPAPSVLGMEAGPGASLALHPTGREGYALAWPGGVLSAFDPRSLVTLWTLELEPAAQGLLVDATGSLLVVETGGAVQVPESGVWPLAFPEEEAPADALALRRRVRPPAAKTLVIDLRARRVVVPMRGAFRRLEALDDGAWLLVTSEGAVRLAPE